jgi:hypothetical protein
MEATSTPEPVSRARSRARPTTSSTLGREATSVRWFKRNYCRDLPEREARAASSSRTSSGTLRTVIAVVMTPVWQRRQIVG